MPHTIGSILTLIVLTVLFVCTSSYYIITIGLRLLGWYLLRKSETRRYAILGELVEIKKKHGGVMKQEEALIVGFFHPFWCAESFSSISDCELNLLLFPLHLVPLLIWVSLYSNAGGGGERVLWASIRATQNRYPNAVCAVYTGDHEVDSSSMLKRIQVRYTSFHGIPIIPSLTPL